ncbi:MAG: magnesium/cobalt transporter CorA [Deltaproteobacteria bacterium]
MTEKIKKASIKRGLQPGALIHVGEKKIDKVRIRVIDFDRNTLEEKEFESIEECLAYRDKSTVSWINIDGLHDTELIKKLGKHFGIHRLVLEDVLNTDIRPGIDDYENYIYIVLKMLYIEPGRNHITAEQVSFVLTKGTVISFQERVGDTFEPVRNRLRNSVGRIRRVGADYLTYALVDAVVDNYFIVLEEIGESIEALEDELMNNPSQETLKKIYGLKREMVLLRKYILPLREMVLNLHSSESPLIDPSTKIYIKDLYSHTIQIADTLESYRDMTSEMLNTYLTITSNKMNEVMKILTIMASIFIPLTFIAGIYGMNFENMPELHYAWGYPLAISMMAIVAVVMIMYFKRKKWL